MNKSSGIFGQQMQISGKFYEMLKVPNITPEDLFSEFNMSDDMKQNI
jgi:hypothetical protein